MPTTTATHSENPIHNYNGAPSVSHSKEDSLTEREFELLLEGAGELAESDYYYAPDPEMTVYLLGRLGLRRGELEHLEEDWIDWREQVVRIPAHTRCTNGADGEPCGQCVQSARQRVEHADGELTVDEALEWMWAPKTEAAARDIYFGFDTRAMMYLERYFESDEYERYGPSGSAISRRVKRAAELADELDPDDIYPHCLRATAATRFSENLDVYGLKQIMGWEQISTSMAYVSTSSSATALQLDTNQ